MAKPVRTLGRVAVAGITVSAMISGLMQYLFFVGLEFALLPHGIAQRVREAGMPAHGPLLLAPISLLVAPLAAWAAHNNGFARRTVIGIAAGGLIGAGLFYAMGVAVGYWVG